MMIHKKSLGYCVNMYSYFLCLCYKAILSSTVTNYSTSCTSSYVSEYHILEFLHKIKRISFINVYSNGKGLMVDEEQLDYSYKILNESLEKEECGEKEEVELAKNIFSTILNFNIFIKKTSTESYESISTISQRLMDAMDKMQKTPEKILHSLNRLKVIESDLLRLIEDCCKVTNQKIIEFKETLSGFLSEKYLNLNNRNIEEVFNSIEIAIKNIIAENLREKTIFNSNYFQYIRVKIEKEIENTIKSYKDLYKMGGFFQKEILKVIDPFLTLILTVQNTTLYMSDELYSLIKIKTYNLNLLKNTAIVINDFIAFLHESLVGFSVYTKFNENEIRILSLMDVKGDKNKTNIIIREVMKEIEKEFKNHFIILANKYGKNNVGATNTYVFNKDTVESIENECLFILEETEIEKKLILHINKTLDQDFIMNNDEKKINSEANKQNIVFYQVCNKIIGKKIRFFLSRYIDLFLEKYDLSQLNEESFLLYKKYMNEKRDNKRLQLILDDFIFLVKDLNNLLYSKKYKAIKIPSKNKIQESIKEDDLIGHQKKLKKNKKTGCKQKVTLFCVITFIVHLLLTYNAFFSN